ncbi:sexual stage antigen s16 [Plasmodium ovale wallikeri]|uniref:Sexual stage antigen s16 n=1 Tax=Plasmodium ovale wallikeri TaxID=864142 RepID=A0A1A8YJI0_PLAOA|nr:sexual stage antigen s16 [Plasmodium ovale wallikeri]
MNFRIFLSSLSFVFLLCTLFDSIVVIADPNDKSKKGSGKPNNTGSDNTNDTNSNMKDSSDKISHMDAHKALYEIRNVSNILEKKTSTNRNIIISTAVINMVILLFLSGLIGYNTRKMILSEDTPGTTSDNTNPSNTPEGLDA